MTDLKTANEQLTEAIAALESNEHEADVREAEALRLRLMELDAKTGARIKAKLEAHKAIALAWKEDGAVTASGGDYQNWLAQQKARLYVQDTNASSLTTDSSIKASVEAVTAENIETVWYREVDKAIIAEICTALDNADVTAGDRFTADAWTAHHEQTWNVNGIETPVSQIGRDDVHTGKYALSGEEIPDPVLVNGVAEMQQVAVSDEQ